MALVCLRVSESTYKEILEKVIAAQQPDRLFRGLDGNIAINMNEIALEKLPHDNSR